MALFAISDLHLPAREKPMDVFGAHWENHFERIREDWLQRVGAEDVVLLPGDLTWAMRLEDAMEDIARVGELPGRKIILRGNHDYWWTTARKMQNFLQENGFDSLHILHNNACVVQGTALCGTRGWPFDDAAAQGEKLMSREAGRLRMSLQAGQAAEQRIAFLHYPPVYPGASAQEIVDVLQECGVTECYYGHLHGRSIRFAVQGEVEGIRYKLISADSLGFCPYKIR